MVAQRNVLPSEFVHAPTGDGRLMTSVIVCPNGKAEVQGPYVTVGGVAPLLMTCGQVGIAVEDTNVAPGGIPNVRTRVPPWATVRSVVTEQVRTVAAAVQGLVTAETVCAPIAAARGTERCPAAAVRARVARRSRTSLRRSIYTPSEAVRPRIYRRVHSSAC